MTTLGKIEEFDIRSGKIDRYLERLEQYFEANGIPPDAEDSHKRRAILISVLGAEAYDILFDLCSPHSPSSKSFADLKSILTSHFAPKRLIIAERFRFYNCKQSESESVSEFAANLKKLACTCDFGTFLPAALRDRFVCGLRSSSLQKKLLADEHTFQQALKVALNYEAADKDVAELNPKPPTDHVHKIRSPSSNRDPPPPAVDNNRQKCLSCGEGGHRRSSCKYRNLTCHSCGKHGHISRACKSAKPLHQVEEGLKNEDFGDTFSASLYKLGSNKQAIMVSVEVQGHPLLMEIDTGASISIISQETYNKHFSNIPLVPSSTTLHTYTGGKIPVCGQFLAVVNYQTQQASLPLTVVSGCGPSLLGRDWLHKIKLNWHEILRIEVSSPTIPTSSNQRLQAAIQRHPAVFQPGLGTLKGMTAQLELKDGAKPKFCKARPVPYALQGAVQDEYDRLEQQGIIEKIEYSEWATPMVHVPKSDGQTRSCGDYSVTLNPSLKVPQYPMPVPEDVFRQLSGGKLFTKLDLTNAYQQMLLDPKSQQYVTINTHRGLYKYKRLPFGIASSPAIFQRTMEIILQGLEYVAVIQDDILITGLDDSHHLSNLEKVLERLNSYGLRLKLEKCKFMQPSVIYMGVQLSAEGILPTQEKIQAIKDAPSPENSTQLRAFLGMVNYHRKFIPNLSTILQPLNQLLQKNQRWIWTQSCQQAFDTAKEVLSSSKILVHFDPKLPVVLECDASQYGVGAVISHKFPNGDERPISYASRSLNPAEKNYSQIHKEALAIIFGITKFYMYLYGRKFTLYTDHQPLLKILAPDSATPVLAAARLQRWSLLLSSYTYDIKFKRSKDIANADALSRLPLPYTTDSSVENHLYYVADLQLTNLPVSAQVVARETARDQTLAKVLTLNQNGWFEGPCKDLPLQPYAVRRHELSTEQGCIMWGSRVVIPPSLRQRLLAELHDSHPGIVRMKAVARSHFWWPKLDSDIETTVRKCRQCVNTRSAPPAALLHPWNFPSRPWQRIHADFATVDGKHYLVVVDAYSKWPEVNGPMPTTTAGATANALRTIFSRYGLPESIVSDNGPPFQSAEYEQFLKMNGIQRILVAPYHPSSNGQAERFVQTFKHFMKASGSKSSAQLQWKVNNFLLTYRSTPHATTHETPAKLFLQREVRTRLSLVKPDLTRTVAHEQSKMKNYFDQHTKFRQFAPGDNVLAKDFTSSEKWQPAQVVQRKSSHSYSVQLSDGRVWNRHVDHLVRNTPNSDKGSNPDASCTESSLNPRRLQSSQPQQSEGDRTDNPVSSDESSSNAVSPSSANVHEQLTETSTKLPVTTRSGRVIERPKRLTED